MMDKLLEESIRDFQDIARANYATSRNASTPEREVISLLRAMYFQQLAQTKLLLKISKRT